MAEEESDWNLVGPVLRQNEISEAVIAAMVKENSDLRLVRRGAYVRVFAAWKCQVTRAAIENELYREFRFPTDLESIMPSFKGRLKISNQSAVWFFQKPGEIR